MDELLDDYNENELELPIRIPRINIVEIVMMGIGGLISIGFLALLVDEWKWMSFGGVIGTLMLWFWLCSPGLYALQWRYHSIRVEAGLSLETNLRGTFVMISWGLSWLLLLPNFLFIIVGFIMLIVSIYYGGFDTESLFAFPWVLLVAMHFYYFLYTSRVTERMKLLAVRKRIEERRKAK